MLLGSRGRPFEMTLPHAGTKPPRHSPEPVRECSIAVKPSERVSRRSGHWRDVLSEIGEPPHFFEGDVSVGRIAFSPELPKRIRPA